MPKKKKEHSEWLITKGQLSRWQKERKRRRLAIAAAGAIIIVVLVLVINGIYDSKVRPYHRTVLKVSGPQTERSFDMNYYIKMIRLRARLSGINSNSDSDKKLSLADQTLQAISDGEVYTQLAEQAGISVTPDEIDAKINEKVTPPDQSGTSPAQLDPAEAYAKFIQYLDRIGVSEKDYRAQIATELLAQKLQTKIEDEKVPETAEQAHIQGILIDVAPSGGTPAATGTPSPTATPTVSGTSAADNTTVANVDPEALRQTIRAKLDAGESFAALAEEYSKDSGSRDKGGDLGWFPQGLLPDTLDKAVFELEPGTLSEPIPASTAEGNTKYWLIRVTEKEDSRPLDKSQKTVLRAKAFSDWYKEQLKSFKIKKDYLNAKDKSWALDKALK